MKILLFILVFFNLIFALDIDVKMYDEKERSSYLIEIEKKLLDDKKKLVRPEKKYSKKRFII